MKIYTRGGWIIGGCDTLKNRLKIDLNVASLYTYSTKFTVLQNVPGASGMHILRSITIRNFKK